MKTVKNGDIAIDEKGNVLVVIEKMGGLHVIGEKDYFPIENISNRSITKIVRPHNNCGFSAAFFRKDFSACEVVWERFPERNIEVGMKFEVYDSVEDSYYDFILYQVGNGIFMLFVEGDYNRYSDKQFTTKDKVSGVIKYIQENFNNNPTVVNVK